MKETVKSPKHISLFGAMGIVIAVLLFGGSLLFTISELRKNDTITTQNLEQAELINSIHSSMAHLTMWQNNLRYGDSSDQFLAIRNINEISTKINDQSQSLQRISILDRSYTEKLDIATQQLIKASGQIVRAAHYSDSIKIDFLTVDYRSVYRIAEFHLSTVQELTLQTAAKNAKDNQMRLIRFLGIELLGILLIGVIILVAITGRKRAEMNLERTEGILTDIFESMPSALITLNQEGAVVRLNRTAHALSISPQKRDNSNHLLHLFPFLEPMIEQINDSLSLHTILSTEFTTESPVRRYSLTLFPMTNSLSHGAVMRFDDITDKSELEEQLRQTQKMNAIGQLAGGIAHDFNNVLGGILNAAELLKGGCDPEEQDELLDLITNASTRAADLTRKLLTFSKKDIHRIEPVAINQILHSMESILHHSLDPRITTALHLETGDHTVMGDAANLQNMFLNLGINAGHAMPAGGTIIFSTSIVMLNSERCKKSRFPLKPGTYLSVEVSDTGTGIAPDVITHIFDPFFTTKESGTGIGLAAAYGTVQQCGGEITVSSVVGEGTTFTILLRLAESEQCIINEDKPVTTKISAIKEKKTILIVDDELIIRKSVTLILNRLGYDVMSAVNGLDGVELYRKNSATIDLILLDMMMPVMSGDVALKNIREISPDVPVLICTGFAHRDNLNNIEPDSIQGILTKPYSIHNLGSKLNEILVAG